jgi:uncharacterized membrane protein YecN with MAPEG domain
MTSWGLIMQLPSITAFYLGVLALLYAVLGLRVTRLRRGHRVLFGDGDNIKLRSAIRAHANFAEYVPIIVLMVALLEMSGMPGIRVHLLMAALLVSRLLHPLGMYVGPRNPAVSDLPGRRHRPHRAGADRIRAAAFVAVLAWRKLIQNSPSDCKITINTVFLILF